MPDAPAPLLLSLRRQLDRGPLFANTAQRAFFLSHAPEVLYSGAMGAGKSRILCEKAWWLATRDEYKGATFGIFRKVAASLPATTLRTFTRDVVDMRQLAKTNKSENWFELTNGSRIYFMGLDPDPITGVPSKVGSLDLAWAGVDEAVEVTEGDWIMLLGRLRDPHMPWHQLCAATNPGPPQHWLKRRFTPPTERHEYLHATAADNRFLPADYQEAIRSLPDNVFGKRLGQGLWVAAEGVIYTLPDSQVTNPDPMTRFKRVVMGIDWGFVHAFAAEVVGQTGSGRLAVLDELYATGTLLDDLIPRLRDYVTRYRVDTIYADPSEPEYIAACQRAGLPVIPATNDILPGIDAVARAITDGLTVSPRCGGLLDELPQYRWAPDKATGGLKDKPVEEGDDACDALRYAVMGLTSAGVLLHI